MMSFWEKERKGAMTHHHHSVQRVLQSRNPHERVTTRLKAEFLEMPGLRLTRQQVARLTGVDVKTATAELSALVDVGFLRVTPQGYMLA
jgi:Fic family protein